MSEIENDYPKIPDELIEKAVKNLDKKWRIRRLKEILSNVFGFILSILVIIGVFTLIYRVEYYFEWNVKNHYKVYLTVSFIITYFIISRAESIESMYLIQNYSKPIFYFIFLLFALIGGFFVITSL